MSRSLLTSQLDEFLARLDRQRIAHSVADDVGLDASEARRQLDVYLNETRVGLDLLEPYLDEPCRILEVGAGIGAFSAFLAELGHDVTAIEPAGPGFEVMHSARRALDEQLVGTRRMVLEVGVEELPAGLRPFDLVFSVHVLEHVPDVDRAITAMDAHVAPCGRSVHVCPNYAFPFDPHFGVPVVPIVPAVTASLLPSSISRSGLWQSLNFITAGRVRRSAARHGLQPVFRPGVMIDMVERLEADPIFRERHDRLVRLTDLIVNRLRLRWLLQRWPASLASPMIFELRRDAAC